MTGSIIFNRDMVWKFGELQSVYMELRFYVKTNVPGTNLLKFESLMFQQYFRVFLSGVLTIDASPYQKFIVFIIRKQEQKDRKKTLANFPDYILSNYC